MDLWTEEENRTLKRLWGSGMTARHIAAEIGRSRGAVIGRANRLGMSKPKAKKPEPIVVELAPLSQEEGCQFPLGDYPYSYCGKPTSPEMPSTKVYCLEHYNKSYRKRVNGSDEFKKEDGPTVIRPVKGWGSPLTRLR